MEDNNDLKVYEIVCKSRFDSVEQKLDEISNKLSTRLAEVESYQNKVIGIVAFLTFVIPLVVSYYIK